MPRTVVAIEIISLLVRLVVTKGKISSITEISSVSDEFLNLLNKASRTSLCLSLLL